MENHYDMYLLIAAHTAVFKLDPDVRADPSKFDRIPVRVMNPHGPLPRFFVGRLEKLHPATFQLFIQCIEVIGR